MIPIKDNPLILTKDIVLDTIYDSKTNDTLYKKLFKSLTSGYEYETKYINGEYQRGECNPSDSSGYYNLGMNYRSFYDTTRSDIDYTNVNFNPSKVLYNNNCLNLNPNFIMSKPFRPPFASCLAFKFTIDVIEYISLTIPAGTELYVSYIKYTTGYNCGVKWNINKSPNPLLRKRVLFTPVSSLNNI